MKPIQLRESDFKREVEKYAFPKEMLTEFFEYWSEPNPSGTKMKFELEKTWHLSRRIARWARTSKVQPKTPPPLNAPVKPKEPTNDIERLDAFIDRYRACGSRIGFDEFGKFYELMREQKLLRKMTQKEVDDLLKIYNNDKLKCRCAVVMDTLSGYVNNGLRVSDIMEARRRLG